MCFVALSLLAPYSLHGLSCCVDLLDFGRWTAPESHGMMTYLGVALFLSLTVAYGWLLKFQPLHVFDSLDKAVR